MTKLKWNLFFRSIPTLANWIAAAAMIAWLAKVLWFDALPEAFPRANQLGEIGEELLSAILAGYIGYLAFALFPQFQEEQSIAPYLQVHAARIVGNCSAVLDEINHAAGTTLTLTSLTADTIKDAFSKVPTASHPRMSDINGRPSTWFAFFRHRRNRARTELVRLERQARFFGSDLALLLTAIDENPFFMMCEAMENVPLGNTTLEVLGGPFFTYSSKCLALMKFHDSEFVPPALPLRGSH